MTPRLWSGGVLRQRRLILIAATGLLIASAPARSQVIRPHDPPQPDDPWRRRPGGNPNDPTQEAEARRRQAQECYDAGCKLLDKKQIQAAKTKFRTVIELVGTEGVGQAALGQLIQIHTEGMKELDKAGQLYKAGRYQEAIELAKKTKVLYAAILDGIEGAGNKPNISQLAAQMIKAIEADPKARAEIQEAAASKRYAKITRLEEAARKDEAKYYDVYKTLKDIVKRYPDTPTGIKSAEQIKKLKADKKRYAIILKEGQRRVIASALQRAEQYEKAGKADQAEAEYKKLKEQFPGKSLEELRRMVEPAKQ